MSGFLKAVAVGLVVGTACLFCPVMTAATGTDGDEEPPEEIPRYYQQLQEYKETSSEPGPMLFEYIVEPGDCLSQIAERFGTDVYTLVGLNEIANPHLIHPGQVLEILTVIGSVHDVSEGDTVTSIAVLYGVDEETIIEANRLSSESVLERGERVIVPGGFAARGGQQAGIVFDWPLQGRFTSGYGWRNGKFHYGIDIAAPLGTPFYAAAGGTVTHASYRGSYGIMIEVDHGAGYRTRYGHASSTAVAVGQAVKRGQLLGYIGVTGNTTGPHLHFEVHRNGEKINPLQFLY